MEEEGGGNPPAAGPAPPGLTQPRGELPGRIPHLPETPGPPCAHRWVSGQRWSIHTLTWPGRVPMRPPVPPLRRGAVPRRGEAAMGTPALAGRARGRWPRSGLRCPPGPPAAARPKGWVEGPGPAMSRTQLQHPTIAQHQPISWAASWDVATCPRGRGIPRVDGRASLGAERFPPGSSLSPLPPRGCSGADPRPYLRN